MSSLFHYREAFSRNIGWVSEAEQATLREKRVAIAGMGGVGGFHVQTLARLGVGAFHLSDMDRFEEVNFNRQAGANVKTLGLPKVEVMAASARDINPDADVHVFPDGVNEANIDLFLEGADLYVDGLDFFVLDIRRKIFARCRERGIPAITAAPLGMGSAYLVFTPNGMSFEDYFCLEGLPAERQYVNFALGLAPAGFHRRYLDNAYINFAEKRGPSTVMACQICAGVTGTEALKLLLGRGNVKAAPWFHHFDPYLSKWKRGRLRLGNRNPVQKLKLGIAYRVIRGTADQSLSVEVSEGSDDLTCILNAARWAPSGDNTQPWTFEILDEHSVRIVVRDQSDHDVYDFNGGQGSLISAGALIESLALAASERGYEIDWEYEFAGDHVHHLLVRLIESSSVTTNKLASYLAARSVNRGPLRRRAIPLDVRERLAKALGPNFFVEWHDSPAAKRRMTAINAHATAIRLSIPEGFLVHQRIIDWTHKFSPYGIPAAAVGLDPMARTVMRWALQKWGRMKLLNSYLGGLLLAQMEMDIIPGYFCGAHFTLRSERPVDSPQAKLEIGRAVQRFWLEATCCGVDLQPAIAPLIFGHYGRNDEPFTTDAGKRKSAGRLAASLNEFYGGDFSDVVFRGRVGYPFSWKTKSRSIRKALSELKERENK